MAKRKRLTPPPGGYSDSADSPAGEGQSMGQPAGQGAHPAVPAGVARPMPPIAQVAGDSAARAALQEVSAELAAARADGRMVLRLPLAQVDPGWLVRDRLRADAGPDDPDMQALLDSLRQYGQRTPIEVVETAPGRYGLISGWRRLTALRRLLDETGAARFAEVLALLRRPDSAGDAYVAMVEENEIRLGLSYYERARIAARAVETGVFETEKSALRRLFGSASRARRSKIGSFLTIHHQLGALLRFPEAVPERLGLALARALESDPGCAGRIAARLQRHPPGHAEAELALLRTELMADGGPEPDPLDPPLDDAPDVVSGAGASPAATPTLAPAPAPAPAPDPVPARPRPDPSPSRAPRAQWRELRPGLYLQDTGNGLLLSGRALDAGLRTRLEAWLRDAAD